MHARACLLAKPIKVLMRAKANARVNARVYYAMSTAMAAQSHVSIHMHDVRNARRTKLYYQASASRRAFRRKLNCAQHLK